MARYILGVDNGGTYIKAALLDGNGTQLALARVRNVIEHPGGGRAELDLDAFWQANCEAIRTVIAESGIDAEEIAVVSFAGQGKGMYLVDAEGEPVYPGLTSSDGRARSYADRWKTEGTDESVYSLCYLASSGGKPQTQLRWLKDNEPEVYERIRWVFSMKDYLVFRLTGVAVAGMGAMSGTNLVNLNTCAYDERLFEAFGIPECFGKMPPLKWDTERVGCVSEQAAEQTGLVAGTPVSAGMFDVNASAIAMGVIDGGPIAMITGTHGVNVYLAKAPVSDGSVKLNSLYSLEGFYQIEEGYPGSSGALEWVLDRLYGTDRSQDVYDEVNALVASIDPASSKAVFLPFFSGWRDAKPATAAFLGLLEDTGSAELLTAAYEGACFFHALQIEHLLASRERPEEILMAGGATNSDVWVQMFADVLQIPIRVCKGEEMGVKGLAITSSVAAGIHGSIREAVDAMVEPGTLVEPRPDLAGVYAGKLETFRALIGALDPLWTRM
ncbi:MAG: carbohydrate kinase [Atopobiaceae bacterium]|nr:carbohydrate kinase [Atopobiaceae bacterium]